MPKTIIDYSNTIFYKITCNDPAITDVYVGHTTNFVQRKHAHKQSCINIKTTNYKCKLYQIIRNNGGWQNWNMEIINFHNCHDHYEARKKEQEYFISLKATLNSIEPMPKPKSKIKVVKELIEKQTDILSENLQKNIQKFVCETCDYKSNNENYCNKHLEFGNHNTNKFSCETCHFKCIKKGDWTRHISTSKHERMLNVTKNNENLHKNINSYSCENCDKVYNSRNGLWAHKKKCTIEKENPDIVDLLINENKEFKNVIIELLKNNNDLQTKMLNVCKNINSSNSL